MEFPPRVFNRHRGQVPENAVYIGRGTEWGNPFNIGPDGDRDEVCDKYADRVAGDPHFQRRVIEELKGKDLVCSCAPLRCHGLTLVRVANQNLLGGENVDAIR